jgi:antitoxin ParD1/3/4
MRGSTSISLDPHFEGFINSQIADGRYRNASEVVRDALRILEDEENQMQALRLALQEGEDSGIAENFDPDEFLEQIHASRAARLQA